jgi:hypothetical protein
MVVIYSLLLYHAIGCSTKDLKVSQYFKTCFSFNFKLVIKLYKFLIEIKLIIEVICGNIELINYLASDVTQKVS